MSTEGRIDDFHLPPALRPALIEEEELAA
jgi:hypothetical protein